jgi:hypothetical protein
MGRIPSFNWSLSPLGRFAVVAAIAIVPCGCSSQASWLTGVSAFAQNADSLQATQTTQNNFSISICQSALQERITQETGSQASVSFDLAETYFVSNAEEGVRGTARVRLQNNNQLLRYRYDCTANIRDGQVARLTYNPISDGGNSDTLSPEETYRRGYQQGRTDAQNNRQYDAVRGTYDLGIQNNQDLSRTYSQGYASGYRSITNTGSNLTPQDAYNQGYRQGQADARDDRQYNATQGAANLGIQNNEELYRSYSQGYASGFQSITANENNTGLTRQQAYDRGYNQGQTDANNNGQYEPFRGVYDLGIQSNNELSRSYTQGYANGYQAVRGVVASSAAEQACISQAESQGLRVLAIEGQREIAGGQEITLQVRPQGGASYTAVCFQAGTGEVSIYARQTTAPSALW